MLANGGNILMHSCDFVIFECSCSSSSIFRLAARAFSISIFSCLFLYSMRTRLKTEEFPSDYYFRFHLHLFLRPEKD